MKRLLLLSGLAALLMTAGCGGMEGDEALERVESTASAIEIHLGNEEPELPEEPPVCPTSPDEPQWPTEPPTCPEPEPDPPEPDCPNGPLGDCTDP